MVTTYTTSQECFDAITGAAGGLVVSTNTRPSSTALDLYRKMAFSKIYPIALTMTDTYYVKWGIELELVKILWNAAEAKQSISIQLTDQQTTDIQGDGSSESELGIATWEPGKDQTYQ